MALQQTVINGTQLIAQDYYLEALWRAHEELIQKGIGANGKLGFIPAPAPDSGWRSLARQEVLFAQGKSKTKLSNHRRGTAVDCMADWPYIIRIAPTMAKYGLINDLAYINTETGQISPSPRNGYVAWDGGHFNWKSNGDAAKAPIINELSIIPEFKRMSEKKFRLIQLSEPGVPGTGGFALVINGEKRSIAADRLSAALATLLCEEHLTKAAWDLIPSGKDF